MARAMARPSILSSVLILCVIFAQCDARNDRRANSNSFARRSSGRNMDGRKFERETLGDVENFYGADRQSDETGETANTQMPNAVSIPGEIPNDENPTNCPSEDDGSVTDAAEALVSTLSKAMDRFLRRMDRNDGRSAQYSRRSDSYKSNVFRGSGDMRRSKRRRDGRYRDTSPNSSDDMDSPKRDSGGDGHRGHRKGEHSEFTGRSDYARTLTQRGKDSMRGMFEPSRRTAGNYNSHRNGFGVSFVDLKIPRQDSDYQTEADDFREPEHGSGHTDANTNSNMSRRRQNVNSNGNYFGLSHNG